MIKVLDIDNKIFYIRLQTKIEIKFQKMYALGGVYLFVLCKILK